MLTTLCVGYDFGNGMTDLCALEPGKTPRLVSMPSYRSIFSIKQYSERMMSGGLSGTGTDDPGVYSFLGRESVSLIYQDQEYILGDLAMKDPHAHSSLGNLQRYTSQDALLFLLATSALACEHASYQLSVVTGLPLILHSRERVAELKQVWEAGNPYEFMVNGQPRRCTLSVMMVVAEGIGVLVKEGISPKEDPKAPQLVIDIGASTTDILVTEGYKPNPFRCGGKAGSGMGRVEDLLMERLKLAYGGLEVERSLIREALIASVMPTHPWPTIYTLQYEKIAPAALKAHIEQAKKTAAEEIWTFIAQTLAIGSKGQLTSGYARCIAGGRGALHLASFLRPYIPQLHLSATPGTDNAQGYATLCYTGWLSQQSSVQRSGGSIRGTAASSGISGGATSHSF